MPRHNKPVGGAKGEQWVYIDDPVNHVIQTKGETKQPVEGSRMTEKDAQKLDRELSKKRSKEVQSALPSGENQWSSYPQDQLASPKSGKKK